MLQNNFLSMSHQTTVFLFSWFLTNFFRFIISGSHPIFYRTSAGRPINLRYVCFEENSTFNSLCAHSVWKDSVEQYFTPLIRVWGSKDKFEKAQQSHLRKVGAISQQDRGHMCQVSFLPVYQRRCDVTKCSGTHCLKSEKKRARKHEW